MSDESRGRQQPPEHSPPGGTAGAVGGSVVPGAGGPPILDQVFDADSLYTLRAAVAAHASQAGLPPGQVGDLVIAVHELAANAVRHGAGHGRLRLWKHHQALHCLVTDDGPQRGRTGAGTPSRDAALWRTERGHGLWVVRQLADQLSLHSGPHGTTATVSFPLGPPGPDPPFQLTQHSERGCIIVVVAGQLDQSSADQLTAAVDEAIATTPAPRLVLDLTSLSQWDSSGLAALVTAQQLISGHPAATMVLAGLSGQLAQRLHDLGLTSRFTLAATTDDAIRQIIPPA